MGLVQLKCSALVKHKDFTPSEAVAIGEALEPLEREAARKRMLAGQPCANLAQGTGKTRDKVFDPRARGKEWDPRARGRAPWLVTHRR